MRVREVADVHVPRRASARRARAPRRRARRRRRARCSSRTRRDHVARRQALVNSSDDGCAPARSRCPRRAIASMPSLQLRRVAAVDGRVVLRAAPPSRAARRSPVQGVELTSRSTPTAAASRRRASAPLEPSAPISTRDAEGLGETTWRPTLLGNAGVMLGRRRPQEPSARRGPGNLPRAHASRRSLYATCATRGFPAIARARQPAGRRGPTELHSTSSETRNMHTGVASVPHTSTSRSRQATGRRTADSSRRRLGRRALADAARWPPLHYRPHAGMLGPCGRPVAAAARRHRRTPSSPPPLRGRGRLRRFGRWPQVCGRNRARSRSNRRRRGFVEAGAWGVAARGRCSRRRSRCVTPCGRSCRRPWPNLLSRPSPEQPTPRHRHARSSPRRAVWRCSRRPA